MDDDEVDACRHVAQIHRILSAAAQSDCDWTIKGVMVPDDAKSWQAAGFKVVNQQVNFGRGPTVLLDRGAQLQGRRLGFIFEAVNGPENQQPPQIDGVLSVMDTGLFPKIDHMVVHPNSAIALRELVLYVPHLEPTVAAMAKAGIRTYRGKAPRPLPGGTYAIALYFFDTLRVLIVGRIANGEAGKAAGTLMSWMMPSENAPELTGLLVIVENGMDAVLAAVPAIGPPKAAVQPGRQIATLRRQGSSNIAFLTTPL